MRNIVAAAVLAVIAAGSVHAGEPGETILDEASPFRCHFRWATPLIRKGDGLKPFTKRFGWGDLVCDTPPPAAGWIATDFDDGRWVHWKGPALRQARLTPAGYSGRVPVYDYGLTMWYKYPFDYARSPALALQCMRGRFTVTDPGKVRNLKLSLAYRGGVVVYVNGKEIARGHLPAGDVAADTLAEDYPPEAFLKPDGRKPLTTYASDSGRFPDRLRLRVRRLENIAIPASALRKGTNVLAVEIHRAPYIAKKGAMSWSTCCLIRLKLTATAGVRPNVSKLTGLRVWTRPTTTFTTPLDCPDPHEPLEPLRIIAARNGAFTGQAIVGRDKPIRRLAATVSPLKQIDGDGGIPASAVEILYPSTVGGHGPRFDPLAEAPPAEVLPIKLTKRLKNNGLHPAAIQPIWLKVRVPADAAPGEYRGTLTIRTPRRIEVPVELKVIDWRLPDPKDYATHVALVQSPDTLALTYDTPQWSEKHWTLIERSFKFLAEVGNKYLWIPLICKTNFGNEQSMVRWIRRPGGGFTNDYSIMERYVDLALKYVTPDVVCLYVWDRYAGGAYAGKIVGDGGTGVKVTLLDAKTGKVEEFEGPKYTDKAASTAFWKPVLEQVAARLTRCGLGKAMMLGTFSENATPRKEVVDFYKDLWPAGRWIENGHPVMRSLYGQPIGYHTSVYIGLFKAPPAWDPKRKCGWQRAVPSDVFPRAGGPATINPLCPNRPLGVHRITTEAALLAGHSGLGRVGADFWSVPVKLTGHSRHNRGNTVQARYPESAWSQLDFYAATDSLLARGPAGAISTARFEMVREGVQESEARIFIEKALYDPAKCRRMGAALVKRSQEMLNERARMIRAACVSKGWHWYESLAPALSEKLFTIAAAVARKTENK